jgi:hypothetical protein
MSRQKQGVHEEDGNEKEELKFINKANINTFPYRIKDISVDGRLIITINGLKNRMQRHGPHSSGLRPGHVAVFNIQIPEIQGIS